VEHLARAAGPSPRQPIRLEGGERVLSGYAPGVLTGFVPGAALRAALRRARLVHVPVFAATRSWARAAWEGASEVAVDLMDLADVDPALVEEALRRSAVVFAGLDEARQADEVEWLQHLALREGSALVVVTLGAEGAVAFRPEGATRISAAPLPGPLVDTTGCGDAFAGVFLARRLAGVGVQESLQAGSQAAARVATRRGAASGGLVQDDAPCQPEGPGG
jgi:sugar/nucleoside kinase (ribokinase family)